MVRTDEYAGVCEQLSKGVGVRPAYCVCKFPLEEGALHDREFGRKLERIIDKLTVLVAKRSNSCTTACQSIGKGCVEWALSLLNEEAVLTYSWSRGRGVQLVFEEDGQTRRLGDLEVLRWRRQGPGVRLKETGELGRKGWEVELGEWTRPPMCSDKSLVAHEVCACF